MLNVKTVFLVGALSVLAGCASSSRVELLEANVAALQAKALVAETANAKATESASEAMRTANQALTTSNDAVEAVSRMAEKCCGKATWCARGREGRSTSICGEASKVKGCNSTNPAAAWSLTLCTSRRQRRRAHVASTPSAYVLRYRCTARTTVSGVRADVGGR